METNRAPFARTARRSTCFWYEETPSLRGGPSAAAARAASAVPAGDATTVVAAGLVRGVARSRVMDPPWGRARACPARRAAPEDSMKDHPVHLADAWSELVATARRTAADGLVVGTSGNVSVRVRDLILVTPSGVRYDRLGPSDLTGVDL